MHTKAFDRLQYSLLSTILSERDYTEGKLAYQRQYTILVILLGWILNATDKSGSVHQLEMAIICTPWILWNECFLCRIKLMQ